MVFPDNPLQAVLSPFSQKYSIRLHGQTTSTVQEDVGLMMIAMVTGPSLLTVASCSGRTRTDSGVETPQLVAVWKRSEDGSLRSVRSTHPDRTRPSIDMDSLAIRVASNSHAFKVTPSNSLNFISFRLFLMTHSGLLSFQNLDPHERGRLLWTNPFSKTNSPSFCEVLSVSNSKLTSSFSNRHINCNVLNNNLRTHIPFFPPAPM